MLHPICLQLSMVLFPSLRPDNFPWKITCWWNFPCIELYRPICPCHNWILSMYIPSLKETCVYTTISKDTYICMHLFLLQPMHNSIKLQNPGFASIWLFLWNLSFDYCLLVMDMLRCPIDILSNSTNLILDSLQRMRSNTILKTSYSKTYVSCYLVISLLQIRLAAHKIKMHC